MRLHIKNIFLMLFFVSYSNIFTLGKLEEIETQMWITAPDEGKYLEEIEIPALTDEADFYINIDENKSYQKIDGFGASMTESSAYVLSSLPDKERNSLMRELFDPDKGLGISLLRQPMGAPDFALSLYTYDDTQDNSDDFELAHFSIERDREYIIPLLKQAIEINPGLRIMASPWSPPAWMKTGKSLIGSEGGRLRSDCYQVYADYFVKFIQAYQNEGIKITAVTPQNEIEYAPSLYTGMLMSAEEQAEFISTYLAPAFISAGLNVKIFCYDHNWDGIETVKSILSHDSARNNIYGVAWHHYGGSPEAMSEIAKIYRDKIMWVTEAGNGRWIWGGSFSGTFREGMREAVDVFRNYTSALILWNIALDQNNGPIVFTNNANYGLVEIEVDSASQKGSIKEKKSGWYFLGHFSKFVKTGAVRIDSNDRAGRFFNHVAFKNPDGSIVVVLFNPLFTSQKGIISIKGNKIPVDMPAGAGISIFVKPFEK
ncbi:glycoside hydrolase family 30 beta sandwich domain-containing protein [Spirochaetia bacterium 38H-sp]|uniref:Glycoside hydrolase family 30 beta sandwich domain-containing protein n=1 Tax=Rarispira pelagica TaxID=3141764 RepID=A0ABU9UBB9_9SPIR